MSTGFSGAVTRGCVQHGPHSCTDSVNSSGPRFSLRLILAFKYFFDIGFLEVCVLGTSIYF